MCAVEAQGERHSFVQPKAKAKAVKAVKATKVAKKAKPKSTLDPRLTKLKALKAEWAKDDPRHKLCSTFFAELKAQAKVTGWWADKEAYIETAEQAHGRAEQLYLQSTWRYEE